MTFTPVPLSKMIHDQMSPKMMTSVIAYSQMIACEHPETKSITATYQHVNIVSTFCCAYAASIESMHSSTVYISAILCIFLIAHLTIQYVANNSQFHIIASYILLKIKQLHGSTSNIWLCKNTNPVTVHCH